MDTLRIAARITASLSPDELGKDPEYDAVYLDALMDGQAEPPREIPESWPVSKLAKKYWPAVRHDVKFGFDLPKFESDVRGSVRRRFAQALESALAGYVPWPPTEFPEPFEDCVLAIEHGENAKMWSKLVCDGKVVYRSEIPQMDPWDERRGARIKESIESQASDIVDKFMEYEEGGGTSPSRKERRKPVGHASQSAVEQAIYPKLIASLNEYGPGSSVWWDVFEQLGMVDWTPITDFDEVVSKARELGMDDGVIRQLRDNWRTYRTFYMPEHLDILREKGLL